MRSRRTGTWAGILGAALAALPGGARCARAEAPAAPKVAVCGVQVVAAGYENGGEVLRAFHWRKGAAVALLVTAPDGLIAVNRDETKVTKMADDKGTDLTVSNGKTRGVYVARNPQVSADNKACIIELIGQGVPAAGATSISVAGTISLKCGTRKEAGRQKVELKPGTEFTVGGMAFTVSKTGPGPKTFELPQADEDTLEVQSDTPASEPFEVTLQGKLDWDDIAKVAFLDAEGKDLGARPAASAMAGPRRRGLDAGKSFILPKKVEAATVVITIWEEYQDVEAPFDLKASVGMP